MATATARSPRNDLASIKLRVSQKRGAHQPQTLTHLLPTTERTDKTSQALWCLEGSHIISIRKHSGAWKAVRHRTDYSSFNTDWNGLNGLDGWDLFPFPRLTPLQPDGDVHPCKRACLPEPPHLSGLPLADGKKSSHGYFLLMRHEPSVQQTYRMMFYRTGNPSDCFSIVLRGHVCHSC